MDTLEYKMKRDELEKKHFYRYRYVYFTVLIIFLIVLIVGIFSDTSRVHQTPTPQEDNQVVVNNPVVNSDNNGTYYNETANNDELVKSFTNLFTIGFTLIMFFIIITTIIRAFSSYD